MYRRRLNSPLLRPRGIEINKSKLFESNNFPNENNLNGFPGFLSTSSTTLLLSAYHQHLRTVSELAFGTTATINQAQKELFRIVEAAERGEGRLRNPRLWHHASQAWNLEFFFRGLVSAN